MNNIKTTVIQYSNDEYLNLLNSLVDAKDSFIYAASFSLILKEALTSNDTYTAMLCRFNASLEGRFFLSYLHDYELKDLITYISCKNKAILFAINWRLTIGK